MSWWAQAGWASSSSSGGGCSSSGTTTTSDRWRSTSWWQESEASSGSSSWDRGDQGQLDPGFVSQLRAQGVADNIDLLSRLGVQHASDLAFLTEEDLRKEGVSVVSCRKLLAMAAPDNSDAKEEGRRNLLPGKRPSGGGAPAAAVTSRTAPPAAPSAAEPRRRAAEAPGTEEEARGAGSEAPAADAARAAGALGRAAAGAQAGAASRPPAIGKSHKVQVADRLTVRVQSDEAARAQARKDAKTAAPTRNHKVRVAKPALALAAEAAAPGPRAHGSSGAGGGKEKTELARVLGFARKLLKVNTNKSVKPYKDLCEQIAGEVALLPGPLRAVAQAAWRRVAENRGFESKSVGTWRPQVQEFIAALGGGDLHGGSTKAPACPAEQRQAPACSSEREQASQRGGEQQSRSLKDVFQANIFAKVDGAEGGQKRRRILAQLRAECEERIGLGERVAGMREDALRNFLKTIEAKYA